MDTQNTIQTWFQQNDGINKFESYFDNIIFEMGNEDFNKNLFVSSNCLVRFYSRLYEPEMIYLEEKLYEVHELITILNFEEEMDSIEDIENDAEPELTPEHKVLFFIPTKWDMKVKSMLRDYKKVEEIFSEILPLDFIERHKLTFKKFEKKTIDFDIRGSGAVSLFKFYNNEEECNLEETINAVNEVKKKVNAWNLSSFYKFGVGDMDKKGLLEKAIHEKCKDPRAYHFNFWKLNDRIKYLEFVDGFKTYDFQEVV